MAASSFSKGKMMIPFNRPAFVGRELDYIADAIARGQLSGDGHYTRLCNLKVAELAGARSALLTHSCTAALEMAAILVGVEPGDEVIMPSFTFVSTANAVVLRGGVPVFVDIDPETLNLDPNEVRRAVGKRTKAIFAVHYAGMIAEMNEIMDIARNNNLLVVEDAAQALGSTYHGRPAGGIGDLATFSFHETKNVISGEGGALTINRPELIQRAEIIREKGTNRSRFLRGQVDKYTWVDIGSSFLPGELIAAFLLAQLENTGVINNRRRSICDRYRAAFSGFSDAGRIGIPQLQPDREDNSHMYYLLMRDADDRDVFIEHMKSRGVVTPFHYVPLHSAPAGRKFARTAGSMAATDDISSRLVRLPLFFGLEAEQQEKIITDVADYLSA